MARAKLYEMNESAISDITFKGQAALIVKSLQNRHPQTAQQIAEDIKADLQTKQDPLRVVSFYMSIWKKAGYVNVVGIVGEKNPVSSGNSSSEQSAGDNESVEDEITETVDDAPVNPPQFDYVGCTLKEAVLHMLGRFNEPALPSQVADELQLAGRTVTKEQVRDTLRKLVKDGKVVKVEDGYSVESVLSA